MASRDASSVPVVKSSAFINADSASVVWDRKTIERNAGGWLCRFVLAVAVGGRVVEGGHCPPPPRPPLENFISLVGTIQVGQFCQQQFSAKEKDGETNIEH